MKKMKKFTISFSMVVLAKIKDEAIEQFEDGIEDSLQYHHDSFMDVPWDIKEEEPTKEELKEAE